MTYLATGFLLLAVYSVLFLHDWLARRRDKRHMKRIEEANERTMANKLRTHRLICEEQEDTQRRICRMMARLRDDWDTDDFDDWSVQ